MFLDAEFSLFLLSFVTLGFIFFFRFGDIAGFCSGWLFYCMWSLNWCSHIVVVSKGHYSDALLKINRVEYIVFDGIVCYGYSKGCHSRYVSCQLRYMFHL